MEKDKVQHLRNEPNIRFKHFKEKYENFLLGDIASFSKGKGLSKSDVVADGQFECIRYGELYTKYGERIIDIYSKTNLTDVVLSEKYDVITPSSGETAIDLATASCVPKEGVVLGGDINVIRTKEHGLYLSYYLNSNKKYEFAKLGQGNSVVHIYNSHLKELKLKLPSFEEQQQVANFISKIDSKIILLEHKLENLKLFKKGILNQSFTDSSKKYKELRFSDIFSKFSTGLNPRNNFTLNSGGSNYYVTIKNIHDNNVIFDDKCDLVDDNAIKIIQKRSMLDKDDILFSSIGRIGDTYLIREKPLNWNINESVFSLKPNKSTIYPLYAVYLISVNKNSITKKITGSTFKSIKMNDLKRHKCNILDNLEDQKAIADSLYNVDNKIDLYTKKLTILKQFKKGLLQQMFV